MAKLKTTDREATLAEVTSLAYGELAALAEECREIVDNASEGLSQTQRIQTLDETAGTLEQHADEPEPPTDLAPIKLQYQDWANSRRGRGLSRADRCAWACQLLEIVFSAVDEEIPDADSDKKDDFEAYRDAIDETKSDCDSLEFPGMFG